jgi:hypothetical protein
MCYFSPVSVHIVDQITTRVKVTRELTMTGHSQSSCVPDSLVGYSVDVTALLISDIMLENANDNISDLVSFAKRLGESAMISNTVSTTLSVEDRQRPVSTESDTTIRRRTSLTPRKSMTPRKSLSTKSIAETEDKWTDEDSRKLIAFKENSSELALQKRIQLLMYDQSTPEFTTRQHFADNFIAEGKSIADIRMAIDGIYDVRT